MSVVKSNVKLFQAAIFVKRCAGGIQTKAQYSSFLRLLNNFILQFGLDVFTKKEDCDLLNDITAGVGGKLSDGYKVLSINYHPLLGWGNRRQ